MASGALRDVAGTIPAGQGSKANGCATRLVGAQPRKLHERTLQRQSIFGIDRWFFSGVPENIFPKKLCLWPRQKIRTCKSLGFLRHCGRIKWVREWLAALCDFRNAPSSRHLLADSLTSAMGLLTVAFWNAGCTVRVDGPGEEGLCGVWGPRLSGN